MGGIDVSNRSICVATADAWSETDGALVVDLIFLGVSVLMPAEGPKNIPDYTEWPSLLKKAGIEPKPPMSATLSVGT